MKNSTYDKLKWLAQVGIPGATTLYVGLSLIWGFPNADAVVATGVVVDTALGSWLQIKTKNYNDGDLNVIQDPSDGATAVRVDPNEHPGVLKDGQKVVLRVKKVPVPPSP